MARSNNESAGGCRQVLGIGLVVLGIICIIPGLIFGYDLLTLFSAYYPNPLPKDPANRDLLVLAGSLIVSIGFSIIGARLLGIGHD